MSGAGQPNWAKLKEHDRRMRTMRAARNTEIDREIHRESVAAAQRRRKMLALVRERHRKMLEGQ